jgi:hypothetical protein
MVARQKSAANNNNPPWRYLLHLIDNDSEQANSRSSIYRRRRGAGGYGKGRATWKGQLARDSGNYGIMKKLTRELILKRQEQVRENPTVKELDRLTLSTIWYRVRKQLYDLKVFDGESRIPKSTRKTVQNDYIKDICKQLGVKRAELGIYAADRAQLYYRDDIHNVSLDSINDLVRKGTDVLIIEKEGIAEVLQPFATKVGIAILNPRGFLTENADDYSQLVLEKLEGKNVATLNDFDASGVCIAKKAKGIISLGVDLELVSELGLQTSQVEEDYNGSSSDHYKWLKANYPDYEHLEYLKHKRVEIDSINAVVGAKQLWEAMLARLKEAFPNRDYNRALDVGTYETPWWYDKFTDLATDLFHAKDAEFMNDIRNKYTDYEGFVKDVKKEEEEIGRGQLEAIEHDEIVEELGEKIRDITRWLK